MIKDEPLITGKEDVNKFYMALVQKMPVQITWKKGNKESTYNDANAGIITYEDQKIFQFFKNNGNLRARLAGDKQGIVVQTAKETNLAYEPSGVMPLQIIAYIGLLVVMVLSRPEMAVFLIGCGIAAFIGFGVYVAGCLSHCSFKTHRILMILFFICVLPTVPSALLLIFAAKNIEKANFYKRLYSE